MSDLKVEWRNNPHGRNDTFWGTWTYGNYGGGGWTGGEFTEPGTAPNFNLGGVDALDGAFKPHDQGYYNAETAWKNSAKTEADRQAYWNAIIAADKTLVATIDNLVASHVLAGR